MPIELLGPVLSMQALSLYLVNLKGYGGCFPVLFVILHIYHPGFSILLPLRFGAVPACIKPGENRLAEAGLCAFQLMGIAGVRAE